tara:strand:+ start:115 stop:339 length:225 start_codon:yes stop_codon:yes gene_type:complete
MIFGFIKKLLKYYIDKLVSWIRIKKLQLELDNEIKKYHDDLDSKIEKPKIIEQGNFGKDGYTISIGNVDKDARN